MNRYQVWARLNSYQTVFTIVYASNDYQAKQLAELQNGVGSVLNYTLVE